MREPSCVLNHDAMREELTEKGLPPTVCPSCGWKINPRDKDKLIDPPIDVIALRELVKKIRQQSEFIVSDSNSRRFYTVPVALLDELDALLARFLAKGTGA